MPEQDAFLQSLDANYAAAQKAPEVRDSTAVPIQPLAGGEAIEEQGPQNLTEAFTDTGRAAFAAVDAAGRGVIDTVTQGLVNPIFGTDIPEYPLPTLVAQPKYTINKIAKSISQYGISLYTGGKVAEAVGAGAAALTSVKGAIGQSALGVGLTGPAHDKGLSDMLKDYPALEGPVADFFGLMAHEKDESFAAGKLKTVLDDMFGNAMGAFAAKVIVHGAKVAKGWLKPGSPKAVAAEADLANDILMHNEAAEAGTLTPEKYPHLFMPEEKPLTLSNPKLAPASQKHGFKQINLDELKIVDSMHPDDVNLNKVQTLADELRAGKSSQIPPIDVKRNATGGYDVVDGRHRLHAARQEGYTSITANVEREAADIQKLEGMADKAGGDAALGKLVEKSFKAEGAFNLTPEQYGEFQKQMLAHVEKGEVDNIFTASLPEGAFNYSKMENRGDVHATLQSLADVIAPQLEKNAKVGKKMSFAEMERTAALFGSKPDVMMANLRSWGVDSKNMPATFLAAKNWSQSLANEIFRDARSVAMMGAGGNTAKLEAMRKITVLADLEGMLKSVQTSAARVTAAGRIRTAPKYTGKQMLELLDEMGGASKVDKLMEKIAMTDGSPEKIAKLLRVSWLRKVLDTHNELWINSILSGVSTHVVNMGTAGLNTFVKPGNIALGGLIRGDLESAHAGLSAYKGLGSVFKDSFSMARKSFAMERPILSVSDKQLEIASTISAANYNLNPESWLGQGVNWLGKAARIPSRFLGAEDEFFKQMSYRAKLNASATMEAAKMVKAGKLNPNTMMDVLTDGKMVRVSEVDNWIQNKFNEGFDYELIPEFGSKATQMGGSNKAALQYANEATFTQSLKVPTWMDNRSFAETMYQAANTHPMLRGTVLPFVKVPANLLREAASYTPGVAQLRKQFWADLAEGGERASEAIGKMATGTTLLAGATYLAVEGRITGGAPTDPDIRKRMYEKNWQPYSFVFENDDGSKTYVPFARFDPWGLVFGIVGDVAQTFQHINEESRHSFAAASTMAVANLLNSRSYLKGMVDALDVLSGGQGQDGVDKFVRIMNSRAASYVPNFTRGLNPDTEIKEVRSMMDAIMTKVPVLSNNVPAMRGYFGDKLMAPIGWPWHAILPSKVGQESTDPGLLELARLSDGPAQAHFKTPEKRVGTLDLTKFKNAQGVTAYDRMMEKLNETDFHEKLNELVQSDEYKAGTDGDPFYPGSKTTEIKKLEQRYHKMALHETLLEFEATSEMVGFDLREMVRTDKRNAKSSKKGNDITELDRLLELNK